MDAALRLSAECGRLQQEIAALKGLDELLDGAQNVWIAPDSATCAWRENDDGIWNTSCGLAWCFECGGMPAEHGMQYCPRCGRSVVVNDAD